ncbi:MAG: TolC family protein [Saprospiraceae bacterium]|nr:TolC family protein [Saprospiraceae bacterium]
MLRNFLTFIAVILTFAMDAQQSFSLEDAVSFGIKNSNEVKMKDIAINDANSQIKELRSVGIPKVNGFVSYQYYFKVPSQPVADFIRPSIYNVLFEENVIPDRELGPPETFKFTLFQPNSLNSGIEATAMLFDGAYLYSLRASKLYKELIAGEKAVTERDVRINITKAYAAVLIAQENKLILQNNIKNTESALREVKALFDNGFAESLDLDRMQLSNDNLQTELAKIEQLIEVSKNILKFHMNYPLNQEIVLSDKLVVLTENSATDLLSDNDRPDFNKRPEYNVIKLGQLLNDVDLKRTKAGYLPTARAFVNAQANLFRQNLFDNSETGWIPQSAIGLSINIPIYDGGDKSAKLQRIRLNIQKSDVQKEIFEKGVTLELKNASYALKNALSVLESRKKSLEISQRIYDKTMIKFREGVGSSVEVTQAEASLYQAQGVYINAIYDLLSAKINYNNISGKI